MTKNGHQESYLVNEPPLLRKLREKAALESAGASVRMSHDPAEVQFPAVPPAEPQHPTIHVDGDHPMTAVAIHYLREPDDLAGLLGLLAPLRRAEWDKTAIRTEWLVQLGALASGASNGEGAPIRFQAFRQLHDVGDGPLTVVLWVTPPVAVVETGWLIDRSEPKPPKPAILGPEGHRLN